jgi:hypothetical protein
MSEPALPPTPDAELTDTDEVVAEVPCVYCRTAIAAETFEFMSPRRQLVSAVCRSCERTVTMRAAAWRRETARTLRVRHSVRSERSLAADAAASQFS